MSQEIQEAVQIIRVAYDGIEIAMKVGSGGISAIKTAMDFLKGMLDYEKSIGKTSMRKLLLKGGDLQVLQFKTEDMRKVMKLAKQYGILYSVLPDVNPADGLSEIMFHAEAVPRINMMLQKLKSDQAKVTTFDEFVKGGDGSRAEKLLNFFRGQKRAGAGKRTPEGATVNAAIDSLIERVGMYATEKDEVSVDAVKEDFSINQTQAEGVLKQLATMGVISQGNDDGVHQVLMDEEAFGKRIRGYRDLAERMRAVAKSRDINLADVTISKKLIAMESETAIKTRIPGTWGKDVRYIWIKRENIMDIHKGKTMLTFLEMDKDYKLYDDENRVVSTMKGEELYKNHYDQVEATVRQRYEEITKKAQTTQHRTKTVTSTQTRRR